MREPRVFTIPPGLPFLSVFADALCGGRIVEAVRDADSLGRAVIYCPTRRAARALALLLAERGGLRAALLPQIVPLGEADEFGLAEATETGALGDPENLAPPIPALERRLILARLVQGWSKTVNRSLLGLEDGAPFLVPSSPADAVALASDLEGLMDSLATEGVPWESVASAVAAEHSDYFGITLDFVRIAAEAWPRIVAERGASDPARRLDAALRHEAAAYAATSPDTPVIVIGSTGSVPATAALIAAVARLPNGAVVLPGLDLALPDDAWERIGPAEGGADPAHGHPQAMLKRLVSEHIRIPRSAVVSLGEPEPWAAARARLLSEALRPADTTEAWADMPASERVALAQAGAAGLAVIEAADERDEALAAALALRETLEHPGRTAALVTPDRSLAARVAAELARWGVEVEDSAGVPLSESPAGRLARLAAEAAIREFEPLRLLALLRHPGLRLGWERERLERAVAALEIGVLRGPRPAPGLQGLKDALAVRRDEAGRHAPRPLKRLTPEDWSLAAALLDALDDAFAPFLAGDTGASLDLLALIFPHRRAVERLAEGGEEGDASGEALEALFDDLELSQAGPIVGTFQDYEAFFAALAAGRALPPAHAKSHRRLKILGPLEARLLPVDRVVLGGLDEGVWPPRTECDAFLNRPMRSAVGLTPPERRIGQTAHDFVQALGARDAVITRARKRGGAPTVPSRFLQRLRAFASDEVWQGLVQAGERWRAYARILETPEPQPPLPRPAPRPDPALIPRRLSVTQVETLIRDPYAIYAKAVLKLDPLDGVAGGPDAAGRGTLVHELFARFAKHYAGGLPDRQEALAWLLAEGRDAFAPIERLSPRLHAEWWPRFQALAEAFVDWEAERRGGLRRVEAEVSGRLELRLHDGSAFTLTARADRIESARDGGLALIDIKTGAPPSAATVYAGFSPQLTLQAAMLAEGAYRGWPGSNAAPAMIYVHASGGRDPLRVRPLEPPRGETRPPEALIPEHLERLVGLLSGYVTGALGFASRPYPQHAAAGSDYDHLARVGEWSLSGDGEEG